MKNKPRPQAQLGDSREPVIVKTALVIALIVGALMIAAGVMGMNAFTASGFDSEDGFAHLYHMKSALDTHYDAAIAPALASLSGEKRAQTGDRLDAMLLSYWAELTGDEAAAKADLDAFIASLPQGEQESATLKLFDAAFAVDGPKVSSKLKKQLSAMGDSERTDFRRTLLLALTDEQTVLPELAAGAVEGKAGAERERILLQLFLVSGSTSSESVPTELANSLKKAVRKDAARIEAYKKAVAGSVGFVMQFTVSHSRTICMLGILLVIDVLLLFFLLGADHSWHFDMKWIIILLIIDFMLLFQMLPLIYLVVKAFFPNGSFTLETFTRLYTYPMNWSAPKGRHGNLEVQGS